jgi:integrase
VTANINRFKFTESSVAKFCVPPAEGELTPTGKPLTERLYWDTEVRGFGVIARANSSSFIVLRDVNRRPVKVTIGRLGAYTVTEAKDIAREHIHAMRNGINPNQAREEKRLAAEKAREEGVTLKGAVAIHVADMRAEQRAAESIDFIENVFLRLYVPELANRPLASLSRIACRELHAKLSTERGPATANRVLKTLRAVWRSAARVYESLPTAPTIAVKFHKMKRRRAPIAWANLPSWWATVESLKNPVRRDLQRLLLFTGLRSTDGKTIRWEHIDFEAGTLHRPKPKGGEDRAFTIPLCSHVLAMLKRRKEENEQRFPGSPWVFPVHRRKQLVSHIVEVDEQRIVDGKHLRGFLPSPHRLRDTFLSAAHDCGVSPLDQKTLANHALPSGDITEGYIRPGLEHLREVAEKIAAFLLGKAGQRPAVLTIVRGEAG